jgi:hypothetical protein
MSALSAVLVVVAVACLLIMALLLSVANRSLREMRASIFPIVREEGAVRVQRARLGATLAAVIAATAAVGSDNVPASAAAAITDEAGLIRFSFRSMPNALFRANCSPTGCW